MGLEFLFQIVSAAISLILGGFFPLTKEFLEPYIKKRLATNSDSEIIKVLSKVLSIAPDEPKSTYTQRITKTLEALKSASVEMEKATLEFNDIMKEKQNTINELETKLTELSTKESELTSTIESLQKVPIEALQYFERMLNKGDKRSAYRDYILFAMGVVVSVIVTIVLKKFGY